LPPLPPPLDPSVDPNSLTPISSLRGFCWEHRVSTRGASDVPCAKHQPLSELVGVFSVPFPYVFSALVLVPDLHLSVKGRTS